MSNKQKIKQKTAASQPKQLTLDDILAHIVDVRPSLGHKIIQFLLDNPTKNIVEIAARLGNHKDGMSTPAMYALEGITMTALEPANGKLQRKIVLAYMKALSDPRLSDDAIVVIIDHLKRLNDPVAITALFNALPLGNPIAAHAIQSIHEIAGLYDFASTKTNALLPKIKQLSPEIKEKVILTLIAHGNIACIQDDLKVLIKKNTSDLTNMDLAMVIAAAKQGLTPVQPLLIKMLTSTNKYLKANAILAMTSFIDFYVDLAKKEGGFENYAHSLEENDDCNCDDGDDHDDCDCQEDDGEYNCEDDYDFQACLFAKHFFSTLPCVASLSALLDAYGETADTAAVMAGALANPDPKMRNFALTQLKFAFTAPYFDEFLYTLAIESKNEMEKCGLIGVLGVRNVMQARPYLISLLQDSNPQIAKAAYNALAATSSDNAWLQNTLMTLKNERKPQKQHNK